MLTRRSATNGIAPIGGGGACLVCVAGGVIAALADIKTSEYSDQQTFEDYLGFLRGRLFAPDYARKGELLAGRWR